MNLKTVTIKRENTLWFKNPPKVFFNYGCLGKGLEELYKFKKCFFITDKILFDLGYSDWIVNPLKEHGVECSMFYDVAPDPNLSCCLNCLEAVNKF